MRFSNPFWLLGLLALGAWWWHGRKSDARWAQDRFLRAATLALLTLAAAGLEIAGGIEAVTGLVVLDRSDSLPDDAAALSRANGLLHDMRPDDRGGLVVFAADAAVERAPAAAPAWRDIVSRLRRNGTDIEGGLRLARRVLAQSSGNRIVLVSDGLQTSGDAVREAAAAASQGIRIDVALPIQPQGAGASPTVTKVAAPSSVAIGEPFTVVASVHGPPSAAAGVALQSDSGSKQDQSIVFGTDGYAVATFSVREHHGGPHVYRVSVTEEAGGDASETSSTTAGAVVVVDAESRVLVVARAPGTVVESLQRRGLRVEHRLPGFVPADTAALSAYDAVVLDDVRMADLPAQAPDALAAYVEQRGGGLLLLGSARTLEPALSTSRSLGALLPIDLRPRAGQRAPAVAIVVAFDKSGSMDDQVEGGQKIEFARQAVQRLLSTMPATDTVGVIAFDSAAVPVAALAAGHDPDGLARALRAVKPGGATAIAPALTLAREWLRAPAVAAAERRHVLLISDGRTSPADAARAREAAGPDIPVSVVALGTVSDRQLLSEIAARSGGRAYFPESISELPLLVAREASRVAGGQTVDERFVPRPTAHAVLGGLDAARLPPLSGYVVSALRPAAQAVLTSHLDDPIMATSRVGSGRVAVYTADLHGGWSRELRRWTGFDALLGQTVRWVARRSGSENLFLHLERESGGMRVALDVHGANGNSLDGLDVRAVLRNPANVATEIMLRPSGPGRYEVLHDPADAGPYVLSIEARSADGAFDQRLVRGFYWRGGGEGQRGIDRALLDRIARMTGGRILDPDEGLFSGPRSVRYLAARSWLVGLALVLFLWELASLPVTPGALRSLVTQLWHRRTRHGGAPRHGAAA